MGHLYSSAFGVPPPVSVTALTVFTLALVLHLQYLLLHFLQNGLNGAEGFCLSDESDERLTFLAEMLLSILSCFFMKLIKSNLFVLLSSGFSFRTDKLSAPPIDMLSATPSLSETSPDFSSIYSSYFSCDLLVSFKTKSSTTVESNFDKALVPRD